MRDKKSSDEAKSPLEEIYRVLFDEMTICVAVYKAVDDSEDFVFTDFNKAAEIAENIPREKVIGRRVTECFPKIKEFGLLEVLRRVSRTGHPENFPLKKYEDNRISGWKDNYVYKLSSGEIVVIYNDMTVQKKVEEQLGQSERRYRLLADNITDFIWTMDLEMKFTYASPSCMRMLGYTPEEILSVGVRKIFTPDSFQKATKTLAEEIEVETSGAKGERRSRTLELEQIRKDGSAIWTEIVVSFLYEESGKATGIAGVTRDITERKKIQTELRRIDRRYRDLFNNSRDGFVLIDLDGVFIDANPAYCLMLGYSLSELKEKKDFYAITPSRWHDWERTEILGKKLLKEGYSGIYEKEYIRKDGTIFPVELQSHAFFDDYENERYFFGIARDISERKNIQKEKEKYIHDLGVFYEVAKGRETRILELKNEIEVLKNKK